IVGQAVLVKGGPVAFSPIPHRGGFERACSRMDEADARVPKDDQVFGGTIAPTEVVRGRVVAVQAGEIAVNQYERELFLLKTPDRLVIIQIADGEDNHACDPYGAQAGDLLRLLLHTFIGEGEYSIVATRPGCILDAEQGLQIQFTARMGEDHADLPVGR